MLLSVSIVMLFLFGDVFMFYCCFCEFILGMRMVLVIGLKNSMNKVVWYWGLIMVSSVWMSRFWMRFWLRMMVKLVMLKVLFLRIVNK